MTLLSRTLSPYYYFILIVSLSRTVSEIVSVILSLNVER